MQEIQSLKNKILMLAIQGKLVPQMETEEPASVLLQKIQQEKEKLIQKKKLKKEKNESIIYKKDNQYFEKIGDIEKNITENIPFEIPENWQWVRLRSIGSYKKGPFGSSLKKSIFVPKTENTIKVYEQKNAINKNHLLGSYYISKEYFEKHMTSFEVVSGDIIVSCAGTIGETYILPEKIEKGIINQALMKISLFSLINKDYFLLFFENVIKENSKEESKGTAMKNIPPFAVFKQMFIPLPPLAEQERIVKKVEEIFSQLEHIEKNKKELEKLKAAFKNKLLYKAIQGKLVPQIKTEEPASVLLQKIQLEKEKLIKDKKIKNNKQESVIYKKDNHYYEKIGDIEKDITKEIPFEIPKNWQWVRLGDIVNFKLGKTPERVIKEFWNSNDIPWVSISDMTEQNYIRTTKEKISNIAFMNKFNSIFSPKGTLLMSFKLTVGKTSILSIDAVHNEAIISIFPYFDKDNYFRNYLYMFLPIFSKFGDKKEAIKGLTLNSKSLANILIPLPPLEEQYRIVKKIEKVFMQCEKL